MQQQKAIFSSLRLLGAVFLTLCTGNSMASGFALIEQSASQMGNAFAGASAFANDASTIYFNPAGMTRLNRQAVVGVHLINTSAEFDGSGTDPAGFPTSGGNGGDAGGLGVIPNFYFSTPLGNDLFAGIGVNVPFGLSTKYKDDWRGRYQAIDSEVKSVNFNPSIAYRVNNQFSIGAGVNLMYMDAKLTQKIDQGSLCFGLLGPAACTGLGLTPQGSDASAKVEGDNWAGIID